MKSIPRAILSLSLIAFLFAVLGCGSPSGGGTSEITVSIGTKAVKAIAIDQLRHVVVFSGPTGTQTHSITGSGTITATVVAGFWNIDVSAYYDDALYAVGSASAEVKAGRSTSVLIDMTVVWDDPNTAGVPTAGINIDIVVIAWDELKDYIDALPQLSPSAATIQISANLEANDIITIPSSTTITLVSPMSTTVAINRGMIASGLFQGQIFNVQGTLNLGHGSYPNNSRVTLDGDIPSSSAFAPIVSIDGGSLNMYEGVILQNNNNGNTSGVLGGAVSMDTTNGGTFNMKGGTIRNNKAADGGGVYIDGTGTFNMSGGTISYNGDASCQGGGVFIQDGAFNMSGGVISGNEANKAGGVNIATSGSLEMSGGAISGNKAINDGGGVTNSGTLKINGDAKIFNNKVEATGTIVGMGGGVFSTSTVDISGNAKIFNNTVESTADDAKGGGVCVLASSSPAANLSISGFAEITNNTVSTSYTGVTVWGGGVYFEDTTGGIFELSENAKINNNIAVGPGSTAALGGGVYVDNGTFDMTGGEIKGNTAQSDTPSSNGGGVYVNYNNGAAFQKTGGLIDGYGSGNDLSKNKVIAGGVIVPSSPTGPGHAVFCDDSTPFGKNNDSLSGNVLDSGSPGLVNGWDF